MRLGGRRGEGVQKHRVDNLDGVQLVYVNYESMQSSLETVGKELGLLDMLHTT